MVLEEATSTTEPTSTFTSDAPTSDVDPYSSSTNPSSTFYQLNQPGASEPIYINLENLPRPLALFFSAQHSRNLTAGITATCTYASKVLRRPLTQPEADAFAFHWAKSMRTASYGTPVGASVACLWAYRYSDYRFPFGWKPMASGRNTPDKLGPFRGQMARTAWQLLRFNAYGVIGMLGGQLFFASYALTVHAAGRAMDPRLKEFTEALKNRQAEAKQAAAETAKEMRRQAEGKGEGETYEMARQRRAAAQGQAQGQSEGWGRRQQQTARRQSAGDYDMSPTGGAFEEDFMETGSDTGLMSDGQSREQQYRVENASTTIDMSTNSPNSTPDTPAQSAQQSQSSTSSSKSQKQPTTTWERLRQNAMSGTPNPATTRPNPSSSTSTLTRSTPTPPSSSSRSDDSFSFSQPEEDRQLARSEAQKEFDARVEREREGKDFNEGDSRGGRGRW